MFDKLKTAFVLVVIGAISGFSIYFVNQLTEGVIADNQKGDEYLIYSELFLLDEDADITVEIIELDHEVLREEVIIYDENGDIIGYVYSGRDRNNYGLVTVLVGVTTDGKIKNVDISSTGNTATFVKIITDDYLSPFASQDINNITVDENTGASFTYSSVVLIVESAATYYLENRGGQ